jgi:hypothetical protein
VANSLLSYPNKKGGFQMLSDKISKSVEKVTKTWTKQKKAEIRSQNARYQRAERMYRVRGLTLREAAWSVMAEAYHKASGNGRYRQLAREFNPDKRGSHDSMVAVNRARDLLIEMTGGAR